MLSSISDMLMFCADDECAQLRYRIMKSSMSWSTRLGRRVDPKGSLLGAVPGDRDHGTHVNTACTELMPHPQRPLQRCSTATFALYSALLSFRL